MQSSRLSTEVQLDLPDPAARRGRKHTSVLPIPSVQERRPQPCGCAGRRRSNAGEMRRRAGLSDDAGSGSSMMKTLCRRMAQQRLRSTVVDAQMTAMEMQRRSVHTDSGVVAQ